MDLPSPPTFKKNTNDNSETIGGKIFVFVHYIIIIIVVLYFVENVFPIHANEKSGVVPKNFQIDTEISNFLKSSSSDNFLELIEQVDENIGYTHMPQFLEPSTSNNDY